MISISEEEFFFFPSKGRKKKGCSSPPLIYLYESVDEAINVLVASIYIDSYPSSHALERCHLYIQVNNNVCLDA